MIEFILQEIEGDGQESVKIQRFDRWQLTGSPDFCVFWVLYEIFGIFGFITFSSSVASLDSRFSFLN